MCPPLPPSQIRSKADSRENGRVGAAETATDAHLHGDSTKKTLDPRDDGTRLVDKADELNHTNMYIFEVRSLRPHRSEDEVNPHHCALCWGLADIYPSPFKNFDA